MELTDCSPSSSPSIEQQRDALRKGLGRSMLWARTGRLHDDALLAACLHDLRYDHQVVDTRGAWLWQMIRMVDAVDRFRVPLLHALYDLSDDRSAHQLCELAFFYAKAGDDAFCTRLYDIVEQKPIADCLWLAEDEIIRLDGEDAFLIAARARGNSLASREWEWDDDHLISNAIERFGEARVTNLFELTTDNEIVAFSRSQLATSRATQRRREMKRLLRLARACKKSQLARSSRPPSRAVRIHSASVAGEDEQTNRT